MAALVIALHAGAIYAFANWTLGTPASVQLAPLQVAVLSEEEMPTQEVLPPPPTISPPVVMVDMPELNIPDQPEPQRSISVAYKSPTMPPPAAFTQAGPKLVSAVEYIRQPSPRYPAMSRRLHEEGLVVLKVLIDELGRAKHIDLHRSSGHDRLDKAAREAVACAKFKPYTEGGVALAALVLVPIEFTLNQRVAQR